MNNDSTLRYRRASLSDLIQLCRLFDLYRVFYKQSSDIEKAESFLRARLDKQDSVVFVAERDGRLVGFTQLYPSFSSVSMKRLWILNDLYVDEASRGKQIGKGVLECSRLFAVETQAKGLILSTQKTNQIGQRLYQTSGYKQDEEFLHYALLV